MSEKCLCHRQIDIAKINGCIYCLSVDGQWVEHNRSMHDFERARYIALLTPHVNGKPVVDTRIYKRKRKWDLVRIVFPREIVDHAANEQNTTGSLFASGQLQRDSLSLDHEPPLCWKTWSNCWMTSRHVHLERLHFLLLSSYNWRPQVGIRAPDDRRLDGKRSTRLIRCSISVYFRTYWAHYA